VVFLDNMMLKESKNKKAIFFEFSSYKFSPNKRSAYFEYKIGFTSGKPLVFVEKIILPKAPNTKQIPKGLLDNLLQSIHIILGISYYKLYCPSEIKLNKPLSKEQADFWTQVYQNGLGEFFYRNNINSNGLAKFPYQKNVKINNYELKRKDRALVGVGGGKDSILAVELLKEQGSDITGFVVETQKQSELINGIIKKSNIPSLKIRRILDDKLFEQHIGIYNGHIPISAVYGFLGLLSAVLYNYSYIIVANEYSSNFGNIIHKGKNINHQWSKSEEFELLLQNYIKSFISPQIKYFSLLRPFYEIRIVEMFSKYKKYFPYFSSCNRNFAIHNKPNYSLWCGKCPKCAFLFLLLSVFIPKRELLDIFGKNLYADKTLLPLFGNLLGFKEIKPFDCVGTFEEAQVALYLAKDKFKQDIVVKELVSRIKNPKKLIKKVFSTNPASNIPTKFRFAGMKNILILGYGKEGKITHKYLNIKYPKKEISIADQEQGSGYLEKQKHYDIAVKTPGLSKQNVTIQYTTATNIFFSEVKNKIIGITGSKGKSTTTSLIYEMLKTADIKAHLLGNIGKPMLEALMKPIKKGDIFVLELSSYQLDDIEFSPNVAIITNLFPEHMDYHGGLKKYYEAKKNIIKLQTKNDFFVYNQKVKKLNDWARQSVSKTIPLIQTIPLKNSAIPLLGEHNKGNIKVAITVAKLFGVGESSIKKAIKNFKPLSHRLEFIGKFKGIKFYDDAISTTPESTILGIKSINNIKTIFLGGKDRGYNFSKLEQTIRKHNIKNVVLFPNSGKKMFKTKKELNILETTQMKKAVEFAFHYTEKGGVCLLSTASPSYSLWKNFEEQGEEYKKWVRYYGKK